MQSLFNQIRSDVRKLGAAEISVGVQMSTGKNIHGDSVSADDTLMKIAYVHEYGWDLEVTDKMRAWLHYNDIHLKSDTTVIHIPERSFIRRGKMEAKQSLAQVMDEAILKIFHGQITVEKALEDIGLQAVTEIVANMGVDVTPIANITRERRKDSKTGDPLHDTGNLLNHVTYSIKDGD